MGLTVARSKNQTKKRQASFSKRTVHFPPTLVRVMVKTITTLTSSHRTLEGICRACLMYICSSESILSQSLYGKTAPLPSRPRRKNGEIWRKK
jgi:hypothetical protein